MAFFARDDRYRFGSIYRAAAAGDREEFEAAVACLEKDSEFQKGHPWKYRMARMLVATGKPRKMMERNRARVARQQA